MSETKTEKLKKIVVDILLNYPEKGIAVPVGKKADVILKAFKDAGGMLFIINDAGTPGFEEIDTREPR